MEEACGESKKNLIDDGCSNKAMNCGTVHPGDSNIKPDSEDSISIYEDCVDNFQSWKPTQQVHSAKSEGDSEDQKSIYEECVDNLPPLKPAEQMPFAEDERSTQQDKIPTEKLKPVTDSVGQNCRKSESVDEQIAEQGNVFQFRILEDFDKDSNDLGKSNTVDKIYEIREKEEEVKAIWETGGNSEDIKQNKESKNFDHKVRSRCVNKDKDGTICEYCAMSSWCYKGRYSRDAVKKETAEEKVTIHEAIMKVKVEQLPQKGKKIKSTKVQWVTLDDQTLLLHEAKFFSLKKNKRKHFKSKPTFSVDIGWSSVEAEDNKGFTIIDKRRNKKFYLEVDSQETANWWVDKIKSQSRFAFLKKK